MTYKDNFTISQDRLSKYLEIKDSYQKRGISVSYKLVEGLIKQWEEEQKGNKLDIHFPQQSKLDILKVGELWSRDQIRMQRPEDIFELLKITIQNLQTLQEEASMINSLK